MLCRYCSSQRQYGLIGPVKGTSDGQVGRGCMGNQRANYARLRLEAQTSRE